MRDILFRGKSVYSPNGWVHGYYWTNNVDNHFIRETKTPDGEYGIWDYEVLPLTVGQYTGLTDKNGVKIFEGDIVSVDHGEEHYTGFVEFRKDIGCFEVKLPPSSMYTFLDWRIDQKRGNDVIIKVIGNIHDNPELLEVDE